MFFFETMKIILFFVLDKLIIVIKMSIFSSFNLLFVLSLHSDELISLTKFFENMIIRRFFHWIISLSFVVWALTFWFAIFVEFWLITFAHIDEFDVEIFSTFVQLFFENCDFSATWIFFNTWEFSFAFDCVFAEFVDEFFETFVFFFDRVWFNWLFNRSIISFLIFCSIVFSNCWKFFDIVSLYDDVMLDFFVKLIETNSKFFSICIWSIATDTFSVKSRFTLARSIWLIKCCIITCSIFAIFNFSNKIFCAFLSVSFIDKTSVEIFTESNFFLSAFWRSSSVFLFR
jgi:hypothetical protein